MGGSLPVLGDGLHEGVCGVVEEVGTLLRGEDSGLAPVGRDLGAVLMDAGGEAEFRVVDDGGFLPGGGNEDEAGRQDGIVHLAGHAAEVDAGETGAFFDEFHDVEQGIGIRCFILMDAQMMVSSKGDKMLRQGVGGEVVEEGAGLFRACGVCE